MPIKPDWKDYLRAPEKPGPYLRQHRAHNNAVDWALGFFEMAHLDTFRSLHRYASAHADRFDVPIGADGVTRWHWLNIAKGLRGLLETEHGRLDAHTMSNAIRQLAIDAGFAEKELD